MFPKSEQIVERRDSKYSLIHTRARVDPIRPLARVLQFRTIADAIGVNQDFSVPRSCDDVVSSAPATRQMYRLGTVGEKGRDSKERCKPVRPWQLVFHACILISFQVRNVCMYTAARRGGGVQESADGAGTRLSRRGGAASDARRVLNFSDYVSRE